MKLQVGVGFKTWVWELNGRVGAWALRVWAFGDRGLRLHRGLSLCFAALEPAQVMGFTVGLAGLKG